MTRQNGILDRELKVDSFLVSAIDPCDKSGG